MQNDWIGLAEAAQLLRVPYQSAHRLVLTGQLRAEKRAGRWHVVRSDVEQLVAAMTEAEPREAERVVE